jgi:hypothetical protein
MNTSINAQINLIPEQQVFTNMVSYRPWCFLWLFVFHIEREVLVWYTADTVSDEGRNKTKLHANFKNNKGRRIFPNKEHAERWLDIDMRVSDRVGENIITKNIPAVYTVRCNKCGHISRPIDVAVTVEGPETTINGYIHVSSPCNGICGQCYSHGLISVIDESR